MSAMIRNAIGKRPARQACRFFVWIDKKIRCAICSRRFNHKRIPVFERSSVQANERELIWSDAPPAAPRPSLLRPQQREQPEHSRPMRWHSGKKNLCAATLLYDSELAVETVSQLVTFTLRVFNRLRILFSNARRTHCAVKSPLQ
jgi:hypothetical protein